MLLEVNELRKYFPAKRHGSFIHAVDGVSFSVSRGSTVGLVGESGSGKTTTGRLILRLLRPTGGSILFDGQDVSLMDRRQLRAFRRRAQIVFQDPYGSLNPRMSVGAMVGEALAIHRIVPFGQRAERVAELLEMVGLHPDHAARYPHEFSGGQRQRIGIARALAVEPDLIVADEPVSALDVSIQAQILNLMAELQQRLGLTYLLVAHDLSVVHHVCDWVAVMYLGKVMEMADTETLFASPLHPYTRALLSAHPVVDPDRKQERIVLRGDIPSPVDPPECCPFATRCFMAVEECSNTVPELVEKAPGQKAACIRV